MKRWKKIYIAIWLTIFSWPLLGGVVTPAHENNSTPISGVQQPAQIKKKDEPGDNVVIIVLLSVVVFLAFVIGITVFIVYRRKVKGKLAQDSKPQDNIVTLQQMDIIPATSTLISSEPNTPNQTDGTQRTFPYPIPRRRLSSADSTTPLLKYRNGSCRSRFSSGVSSRIDSNIAEGKEKGRWRLFRFVRTTSRRMAAKPIKSLGSRGRIQKGLLCTVFCAENLVLVPNRRIWVRVMVDVLKVQMSICQSDWSRVNSKRISGISSSPLGTQNKDIRGARQTLLNEICSR